MWLSKLGVPRNLPDQPASPDNHNISELRAGAAEKKTPAEQGMITRKIGTMELADMKEIEGNLRSAPGLR